MSAQSILASGADADVTQDGLHRVNPTIMEAAWVRPDFDLSGYTKVLVMPTAVQFRAVPKRRYNARTRATAEQFPLDENRKQWLRDLWSRSVQQEFSRVQSYEVYSGAGADVLVVQGFLVDVVSRIAPSDNGSSYALVSDPWSATVVLELRDGMTAELLARTLDRRNAQGLLESAEVWFKTEELFERWAQVLADRLQQLSELGGRPRRVPDWAR